MLSDSQLELIGWVRGVSDADVLYVRPTPALGESVSVSFSKPTQAVDTRTAAFIGRAPLGGVRPNEAYLVNNLDDHKSTAARAALSGAGPLKETPSMPERRAEPWPDTSQDGDLESDGPARRRVPRIVAMTRPIRPAGIEWPSTPRSAHRSFAVSLAPAARLPEPPAAFDEAGF